MVYRKRPKDGPFKLLLLLLKVSLMLGAYSSNFSVDGAACAAKLLIAMVPTKESISIGTDLKKRPAMRARGTEFMPSCYSRSASMGRTYKSTQAALVGLVRIHQNSPSLTTARLGLVTIRRPAAPLTRTVTQGPRPTIGDK